MLLQGTLIYFTHLLTWTTLLARASPQAVPDHVSRRATICNGYAELCDRGFGQLTFIGTHNSYAIGTNVSSNQDQSVLQQLNDGIRMLQIQAHNVAGQLRLCHTSCSIHDGGSLAAYLKIVKSWLDVNPNEVLSILIVNINNVPARQYATVFTDVGLDKMSYSPNSATLPASNWPTMGSLIDTGTRLLTYIDNAANQTEVPYIIDEFSNIWETAYGVTNATFDCRVNRTRGDTSTQMFLINHFLDVEVLPKTFIPDMPNLNQTNGLESVRAHVETCRNGTGRPPNFILVDYYEYGAGSVFQVAASINSVTYSPTSPIATPSPSPTASVTSSKLPGNSAKSSFLQLAPFIIVLFALTAGTLII